MDLTSIDILIAYEMGLHLKFTDRKGHILEVHKDSMMKLCPGILNRICRHPERWAIDEKEKKVVFNRYTYKNDDSGWMQKTPWVTMKWNVFKKDINKLTLVKIEKKLESIYDV